MAALTGQQIAQIIGFVAPGFLARAAYGGRWPRREPAPFTALVWAVILSLPLVAVTNALARLVGVDPANVLALPYLGLLLGLSVVAGYIVATLRARRGVRRLLGRIGLVFQPEQTIYAQTLLGLPPDAAVTVLFTDGRRLSGTPMLGPGSGDDELDELYITHPAWWDARTGTWQDAGAGGGVIVPLRNVHSVTLDRDAVG